jgi:hypothetical protein
VLIKEGLYKNGLVNYEDAEALVTVLMENLVNSRRGNNYLWRALRTLRDLTVNPERGETEIGTEIPIKPASRYSY